MLPLSVLTLALLGGYIFVSNWHPTSFLIRRSAGYHLLFFTAIAGMVFLLLAQLLSGTALGGTMGALWESFVWRNPPTGFGRASAAFFMGASLWWLSNFVGKKLSPFHFLGPLAAMDRAFREKGDPLEMFLYNALRHARETDTGKREEWQGVRRGVAPDTQSGVPHYFHWHGPEE